MSKIVFYSNYLNHHQLPFAKEMTKLTNHNFYFVSQKSISEKRLALGYRDISNDYDFVVKTYESEKEIERANALSLEADYVIFGGNSKIDRYVFERIRKNKITFEYSERLNKRKPSIYLWIKKYLNMFLYRGIYRNKKLFLLCAGSYVANDFKEFNMYQGKTYKWGYFPETKHYSINELTNLKNNEYVKILWVGRFLDWKHPEYVIELARQLRKEKIDFKIEMVGNGELENSIQKMISDYDLDGYVSLLGSMSFDKVRSKMEESNIFLFTSDYQEGWGAVLNEAMNSGCACVASHAAGSTGFLIENGINGYIYEYGNFNQYYEAVKDLLINKNKCFEIGVNAYKTITEIWNAEVATKRFIVLAENLLNGEDTPYTSGPCSKAFSIKDKNMYNYLVNNENSRN